MTNNNNKSNNNIINKKVKTYCDTTACVDIDLGMYPQVILSKEEKIEYLNQIIGKIHKALHLIEEEKETGFSPSPFISGLMFELNAADLLYNNKFVAIIVKLEGIRKGYKEMEFAEVKKQIFEIRRIINRMIKEISEE